MSSYYLPSDYHLITDVATNLSDLLWNEQRSVLSVGYKSMLHEGKILVNCIIVFRIADGFIHEQLQV
jgi:hypothetical protein